ncbi:hypothetical protein EDC04DRAFT_847297 [Pisolithus marmoratus]|nr:hypothetical protein EDC04DRAFT_847297 [Pisolithus marmoratus]
MRMFLNCELADIGGLGNYSWYIINVDWRTWYKAERHPDTQVIVYQCKWDTHGSTCAQWIEGTIREIRIHLRKEHGIQGQVKDGIQCKWSGCAEEYKYGSIPRHVTTHLKVTFRCSNCDTQFPRDDRIRNHCRIVEECANAESVTVAGPGGRLIRMSSYGV